MTSMQSTSEVPSDRPRIAVPAEQGEFMHHAEDAEAPCVTGRPAPQCGCGRYDLEWAG